MDALKRWSPIIYCPLLVFAAAQVIQPPISDPAGGDVILRWALLYGLPTGILLGFFDRKEQTVGAIAIGMVFVAIAVARQQGWDCGCNRKELFSGLFGGVLPVLVGTKLLPFGITS